MVIELSELTGGSVISEEGRKLGSILSAVVSGQTLRVAGFFITRPGLIARSSGLRYEETLLVGKGKISVEGDHSLLANAKGLRELQDRYGPVIGVTAKTESGRRIGKVTDLLIEAENGLIVRFYLRNILKEQIIPRQFVVAITPKQIVFKDIVDQPLFDQAATLEAKATT